MPKIHEYTAKPGMYIRTCHGNRMVTYQLVPAAVVELRQLGFRDCSEIAPEVLRILVSSGLAYTNGFGAGQVDDPTPIPNTETYPFADFWRLEQPYFPRISGFRPFVATPHDRRSWCQMRYRGSRYATPEPRVSRTTRPPTPPPAAATRPRGLGLPGHVYEHLLTMARLHAAGRYDRLTHDVEAILGRAATIARDFVARHAESLGPKNPQPS